MVNVLKTLIQEQSVLSSDLLITAIVSFVIAFFCSQAGISGAFLLLPFQISFLGFTSPSVNATNFLYNVIAIPSGVYRYAKEGRFLWIMALVMIAGITPGIFIGSFIRTLFLLDVKTFKLFVGLVLAYIGLRLLKTALKLELKDKKIDEKFKKHGRVLSELKVSKVCLNCIEFEFWNEKYSFSPINLFAISFVIGIIGGAYGVGGGALLAPLIVAFFKLPVYTIAGATLFSTFVTSIIGVISYTALGYPPNLRIGLVLGFSGFIGIYIGSRLQKLIPERVIRIVLSIAVLILALRYISQYWW